MYWRLLPHAFACFAGSKLILLDLRQDRYFAVPEPLLPSMHEWLERKYSCAPPENVADLLTRSLILRRGDEAPTNALKERVSIPANLASPIAQDFAVPALRQAATIMSIWLRLRSSPLRRILDHRSATAIPGRPADAEAVSICAALYDKGRSFTPITRNCLLDSLALDRTLARKGLGATLVFGVCPTPFSAHCWLQTKDLILNDSFDHVSRFTPIYAS